VGKHSRNDLATQKKKNPLFYAGEEKRKTQEETRAEKDKRKYPSSGGYNEGGFR